jgi:hypothetical protein
LVLRGVRDRQQQVGDEAYMLQKRSWRTAEAAALAGDQQ